MPAAKFTGTEKKEIDDLLAEATRNMAEALRKVEAVLGASAGVGASASAGVFITQSPPHDDTLRQNFYFYDDLWDVTRQLWKVRAKWLS